MVYTVHRSKHYPERTILNFPSQKFQDDILCAKRLKSVIYFVCRTCEITFDVVMDILHVTIVIKVRVKI